MSLRELIAEARGLANDHPCQATGHLWETEGGRCCPKGVGGCSQAVYRCARCGCYDYGDKGGPAYAECYESCRLEPEPEYLDCKWSEDETDACPFCSGEACNVCGDHPATPCEHDSLERHRIKDFYRDGSMNGDTNAR